MAECNSVECYLGLPTFIGKNKEAFKYIKERMAQHTQTWYAKSLSRAGKEIMIKAVGEAIPIYVMGVFYIPDGLCKDMEIILNKFFWNHEKSNRGLN